jgi:hypothetical protein
MKRIIWLSIFIFFCVFSQLYAATIMIQVDDQVPEGKVIPSRVFLLTAVESGIMDVLFDEGNIVFNTAIDKEKEELSEKVDPRVDLAEVGGASYLLYVWVSFDFEKALGSYVPKVLQYHYYDVTRKKVLYSNTIGVYDISNLNRYGADGLSYLLGKKLAQDVIGKNL